MRAYFSSVGIFLALKKSRALKMIVPGVLRLRFILGCGFSRLMSIAGLIRRFITYPAPIWPPEGAGGE